MEYLDARGLKGPSSIKVLLNGRSIHHIPPCRAMPCQPVSLVQTFPKCPRHAAEDFSLDAK